MRACIQGNLGPNSSDWGTVFFIIVLVASAGYMAVFGGAIWRGGRGLLPHRQFWSATLAMTQVVVCFTLARLRGQSFTPRTSQRVSAKSRKNEKQEKQEKKEKKEKREKKGKGGGDKRERASAADAESVCGTAEALLSSSST